MSYNVFVGIDVSKESFSVCAIDSREKVLFEDSLPMDKKGFKTLLKRLKSFPKNSILIGKESSGCYHINLFVFLCIQGFHCVVLNPLLVSNFMKLNLRKTKTDRIDARAIASMLCLLHEKLPEKSFISEEFKELARERESLTQQIAKLKNDIEKLCSVLFPELERRVNIYSSTILRVLERFPSAQAIASAPQKQIEDAFSPESRGRSVNISPEQLKALAKDSIGQFFPMRELILSRKIKQLFLLKESLQKINELLKEVCKNCAKEQDVEILKSIKGVGEISAMHFVAEIQDINRFSSPKKLIAYCGLDPTVYQSGIFQGKSRISKRGNRHLRRIIYLMAVSVARFNPYFRIYFNKRRNQGLPFRKAILATAHKLVRVIYAMLSRKTYFSISHCHSHYIQEVNSL